MTSITEFRGHSWLKITGNALTPQRFWDYQLLTESEYNVLPQEKKGGYNRLTPSDLSRLEQVFT